MNELWMIENGKGFIAKRSARRSAAQQPHTVTAEEYQALANRLGAAWGHADCVSVCEDGEHDDQILLDLFARLVVLGLAAEDGAGCAFHHQTPFGEYIDRPAHYRLTPAGVSWLESIGLSS